ncbi:glycerate kinase [Thermotoga sp. SG1]|uniref:glycerate kinase type-2 family protein n=1 Tax=Thermotoga sp. SG1 TaxID=126739 RepID=UPI000CC6BD56|nr:glycerate kinase [Thermotoga sp. SG1]PLV55812.1 glycerate kinase [Thermotoga sp. SG1]
MSGSELLKTAIEIARNSIESVLPDRAVKDTLKRLNLQDVLLVSVGKAAWRMAQAAYEILNGKIRKGIVITKYGHSEGPINDFEVYEAGHPIPDENTLKATRRVIEMVEGLNEKDTVLFLLSGGGSALFELPMEGVSLEEIQEITDLLLKSGANIEEINTVRKHLSQVKGGRFAEKVHPAKVITLVLSDVLGDRIDVVASGPTSLDTSTSEEAIKILERYKINVSNNVKKALLKETPKHLSNVEIHVLGNVQKVCEAAKKIAIEKGFNSEILTTALDCEAKEAGRFIASIMKEIKFRDRPLKKPAAVILGGETVVHVKGKGLGGRNQELALSAAIALEGIEGVVLCSVGTDGTDGPTDAAGGIVDGRTVKILKEMGEDPIEYLENNDSYNALKKAGALFKTGPTGTNVNDLIVGLVI